MIHVLLSKIKQRLKYPHKRVLSSALILLVFIPTALLVSNFLSSKVEASWIAPEWQYRQVVNISSHSTLENNVFVTLPSFDATDTGRFQSDCGDLRFTTLNGNTLEYFVVNCNANSTIHVFFNSLPAGNTNFYMYYGNSDAADGFELVDFSTEASNISSITFQEEEARSKPMAHWRFDESSWSGAANEIVDSSGNGNHGTSLTGATTVSGGVSNNAGSFDGVNDVLQMNYVNPGSNLTISAWINPSTISGTQYLITANRGGCSVDRGWTPYAVVIVSGQIQYRVEQTSSCSTGSTFDVYQTSNVIIPTDVYSLLTVVVENNTSENRTVTFFINGKLLASTQVSNFASTSAFSGSGFSTYIGGKSATFYSGYSGLMDEVKIYNRVQSINEIQDNYYWGASESFNGNAIGSTLNPNLPTPLIHYKFDEQSGQFINNSITTNFQATLGASSGTSTDDPAWNNEDVCRTNSCIRFDGTSDYVNAGNIGDLGTVYSVSLWSKYNGTGGLTMTSYRTDNLTNANNVAFQIDGAGSDHRFIIRNNAGTIATATSPGTLNTDWNHIMGVRDGNTIRIYVNGVFRGSATASVNAVTMNRLIIGSFFNDITNVVDTNFMFNGQVDEFKVFSTALTPEQVMLDYNANSALNVGTTASTLGASLSGGNGNGPVAEYLFSENTGTSTYDSSTNNSTGTLNNGTTWTPGKVGSAVLLDGIDDNVTFPSSTPLNLGASDFTIEAFVKGNNLENSDIIVGKTDGGACSTTYGYSLGVFDSLYPTLHFCTAAGSHAKIQGTQALSNNQWYHIAVVVDRDSTVNTRMYVNGIQVTTTVANLATHTGSITNTEVLAIGSESDNGFNWSGEIDQVRIYNYVRNQTQISYNYNKGEAITWLKLDQSSGTTAFDSTVTQVIGTLTNMSVPAVWQTNNSCRFGGCLDFDGTNDRVVLSNEPLFDFERTTPFSVCTWANFDTVSIITNTLVSKLDGSNRGWELTAYDGGFGGGAGDANGITFYIISTFPGNRISLSYDNLFVTGQWYHICATYNGSSNSAGAAVYLDGKLLQPVINVSTLTGTVLNNVSTTLGSRPAGTLPLNGKMDDVRIYNYPLSATQVQQIYNNGAALLYE